MIIIGRPVIISQTPSIHQAALTVLCITIHKKMGTLLIFKFMINNNWSSIDNVMFRKKYKSQKGTFFALPFPWEKNRRKRIQWKWQNERCKIKRIKLWKKKVSKLMQSLHFLFLPFSFECFVFCTFTSVYNGYSFSSYLLRMFISNLIHTTYVVWFSSSHVLALAILQSTDTLKVLQLLCYTCTSTNF